MNDSAQKSETSSLIGSDKFLVLFENLDEGVVFHELVRDENGVPVNYRILEMNPAFEIQTGMKREFIKGKLATDAYGVAEPPYFETYVSAINEKRQISFEEYFSPLKRHFSILVVSPSADQFFTVFRDVTKEKQLLQLHKELLQGIDKVDDVVFITDIEGNITFVNPGFEKTYGYSSKEILGKNPRILKSGKQDNDFYKKFWETLKSGNNFSGDLVNITKDGKQVIMTVNVAAIKDEKDKVISFMAVQKNVTEVREVQSKIMEKIHDLEKLNKLMIGRELKMIEMKKEIDRLKGLYGK